MGKRRSQKRASWLPRADTDAEEVGVIKLTLTASSSFFEKATLRDCPATPEDPQGDIADGGTTTLSLDDSGVLDRLIVWFREGSDGDLAATLAFPACLSKFQRAKVHSLVKSVGLGSLQSVSKGLGDDRFISIERSRDTDQSCQAQMTSAQQHKSFWIYRWAKEVGVSVSRDEVSEMLLSNALSTQLEQLWNEGSAQQKLIIKLCEATVEGDTAALKDMLAMDEVLATVRSGKYDLLSGKGVLHCAAREGRLEVLEMLIEAGAPIDAHDGNGLTALQVSRQHPEQCDAESTLLRNGALDTTSHEVPVLLCSMSKFMA
ncbi:hypothetical protein WJX75_006675 [Coccomyxa subellipsoidea]|uniref:R3H domain-containing protein n=1 Tax=Coccomyxa subellipsoidea TaxID=248742 RepID=A0ABR2YGL1_9CHLO